jgi:hypothetical protein
VQLLTRPSGDDAAGNRGGLAPWQARKVDQYLALGDGKGGTRYVVTVSGRGYTFVAPIKRSTKPSSVHAAVGDPILHMNLPARLMRMVGRSDDTNAVSTQLRSTRFVTIGPRSSTNACPCYGLGSAPPRPAKRPCTLRWIGATSSCPTLSE